MLEIEEVSISGNGKMRIITVLPPSTIGAGITFSTENLMPYLFGSDGYISLQVILSGSGKLNIAMSGSVDLSIYDGIYDSMGNIATIATGLLSTNSGRCYCLSVPVLPGVKFVFSEVGATAPITVTAKVCCRLK